MIKVQRDLLWTPHAKERARSVITRDGRHMTFTPKGTREAQTALAKQWVGQPIEGPIGVGLTLSDERVGITIAQLPEPTSRKLRRGDIDNYSKLILDALNKVAWLDDRQIVQLNVKEM